jgi:hypothetical protein
MDYSLCEAVKYSNVGAIQKIIHLYDINCQYHIYFADRVDDSLYLSMPSHHEIYHGIGLMHIGGHIPTCFARFSPTFIPDAGQVDGEILESLWSVLNEVSPSTQNVSHTAQQEMLDSNWKKILGSSELHCCLVLRRLHPIIIVVHISCKYQKVVKGLEAAAEDLAALRATTSNEDWDTWNQAAQQAQVNRRADPTVMDIYDSAMELRVSHFHSPLCFLMDYLDSTRKS